MIHTSYFGNLRNLPDYIIPISICGKAPEWYKGLEYKKLAPKWWFFKMWKQNHDWDIYVENFKNNVLGNLHWNEVYDELYELAESCGKEQYEICLICYEKPADHCHRHLVSDWFNHHGIYCREWED